MSDEDLDDVAERLYALAPEDFTAARDEAAKAVDDKQTRAAVKALRRPSVSAWAVNALARQQPGLLSQLLELGPALAEAQRAGQGEALRTLGQQRRELVTAVSGTAAALTGRDLTPQVRAEVATTLEAALADPAAAEAVRSGRLVRALSYAGLGDVDVEGAVAAGGPAVSGVAATGRSGKGGSSRQSGRPRRQRAAAPSPDEVAAVEQAALDAAAALDDAVRACELADRRHDDAVRHQGALEQDADAADDGVRELEEQLAAARARQKAARAEAQAAADRTRASATGAEQSRTAVSQAQQRAERARAALHAVRRR